MAPMMLTALTAMALSGLFGKGAVPFESLPIAQSSVVSVQPAAAFIRVAPSNARCPYCVEFDMAVASHDDPESKAIMDPALASVHPEAVVAELGAKAASRLPARLFGTVQGVDGAQDSGAVRIVLTPLFVFSWSLDALHVALRVEIREPGQPADAKPRYRNDFWWLVPNPKGGSASKRKAHGAAWAELSAAEFDAVMREALEGCLDMLAFDIESNGAEHETIDKRFLPLSTGLNGRTKTIHRRDGRDWAQGQPNAPMYSAPQGWREKIGAR